MTISFPYFKIKKSCFSFGLWYFYGGKSIFTLATVLRNGIMRGIGIKIYACLLVVFLTGRIAAQQVFRFTHLGTEEGLSNSSVTSMYQDEFGIVWIGTSDGLNRYDGQRIEVFRPIAGDETSIYNNNIQTVCGDGKGKLYVLCKFALCELDLRTEKFRTICEDGIRAINYSRNTLWVAASEKVYRLSENGLEEYYEVTATESDKKGNGLSQEYITSLYASSSGILFVGTTDKGLLAVDENKKTVTYLPGIRIVSVYEDSKKNLWVGTRYDGLYKIEKDGKIVNFRQTEDINSIADNFVRTICEDSFGNYWIGTFKGMNYFDSETQTMQRGRLDEYGESVLPLSSVWSIMNDRQGSIWIGSYFGGVNIYNREFDIYHYHPQFFRNPLSAVIGDIEEDGEGNLWVGSEDTGLVKYNPTTGKTKEYVAGKHLLSNSIKTLYWDPVENAMWVGSSLGGLDRIDLETDRIVSYRHDSRDPSSIPSENVRKIVPWGERYLVLSTQMGVALFDKQTKKSSIASNSPLISRYITDMMVDNQDNCWAAVSGGVVKFNLKTGEHFNYFFNGRYEEMGTNFVVAFFQDSHGRIWLGTSGSGLFRYIPESDSFECISSQNSALMNDFISDIDESPSGYILLATNGGLVRYDYENDIFYNYNKSNGFPVSDITAYGLYVAHNNDIYVCGYRSLVSFRENDLITGEIPTDVYFATLRVNNRIVTPGDGSGILQQSILYQKSIDLYPRHTVFALECATSDYIPYTATRIEYKLEGFDRDWIEGSVQRPIVYTNLQPKVYRLLVRSLDSHTGNVLGSNMLTINVHPPFYKTVWASLLLTVVVMAIAFVLIRFYVAKLKLHSSLELEKLEKKKMQEVNHSKLQFFTYVSHELRTPVTLIQSQVESILQKHNVPPAIYNRVVGIQRNLQRMNKLINELLDFKKQEQEFMQMSFSRQDIVAMLNKILLSFKEYAASKNIELRFDNRSGKDKIEMWYDPEQLEKVFYNLVSNALKYTPNGRSVTVELSDTDSSVRVKVIDTGEGIDPAYHQAIFDPFFQVPDNARAGIGTGLGLSITKGILKALYGEIALESEKGKGSTFTVTLPKGDGHIPAQLKRKEIDEDELSVDDINSLDKAFVDDIVRSRQETGAQSPTIMIVEDNDELRHYLALLFEPIYKVIVAHDGLDAWQKLDHDLPDIILSDLMMPNMDGNELCIKVKNNINTSHIPFVMLTAKIAVDSMLEGFKSGADDYIAKPFNSKILITKCNNLVNTRIMLQNKFVSSKSVSPDMLVATNAIDHEFMEKAIQIVTDNMTNPDFDVVLFAREMAMGRTRFFMKLKGVTGQTPNRFITNIRLKKSVELLQDKPDLSIGEISYLVGFNSPSYFIKSFKALFGITPSTFKSKHKTRFDEGDGGGIFENSDEDSDTPIPGASD